jgi:hypothetical protein
MRKQTAKAKAKKTREPPPDEIDPDGHRLWALSYFEFYRRGAIDEPGLFIQKYGVSLAKDKCPFIPTNAARPPLKHGATLFTDITELDVQNLLRSLNENEPHFFGYLPLYRRGEFVFGLEDVLWMLKVGPQIPEELRSAAAIAAYLNALRVGRCELIQGATKVREWHVYIDLPRTITVRGAEISVNYGTEDHLHALCRRSSLPQRTIDVIPILLMTDPRDEKHVTEMNTTLSTRRGTQTIIDGVAYENLGCAHQGRNLIVGAGEHLEPSDAFVDMAESMPLEAGFEENGRPIRVEKRLHNQGAVMRALTEEVGLTAKVIARSQLWLLGRHQTTESDDVSRDLRYWPRRAFDADGNHAPVLYGYKRNTATVLFGAVMHVGPGADERTVQPSDTGEISSVQLRAWGDVVHQFCDGGELKPAFGWAHQQMVYLFHRRILIMVCKYTTDHGLLPVSSLIIDPDDATVAS